jgi:hypothetical protein
VPFLCSLNTFVENLVGYQLFVCNESSRINTWLSKERSKSGAIARGELGNM